MNDFDEIRQLVMDCIRRNRQNTSIMYDWKETIRKQLMEVRNEFISMIDDYTEKFLQSLRDVDQSSALVTFAGEDKSQQY